MPTIRKATAQEKSDYLKTKPVYPLYGYVTIDGHKCAIEDLRGCRGEGDPRYELMAPQYMVFSCHDLHSILCFDVADLRDQVRYATLAECYSGCEWCGKP